MVKVTAISEAFELKQRLIDNKPFLVNIEKSKTKKRLEKIVKSASVAELNILKDLIKNIAKDRFEMKRTHLRIDY